MIRGKPGRKVVGVMHTDQTWLIVLSDLSSKGRVAKKDYQSWLERTKLLGLDREAGTATVGAPDSWTVETLNKRYRETVAESLSTVLRQPVTVEFVVLNSAAPVPANGHTDRRESAGARPARNLTSNPPRSPAASAPPALQLELGAGSDGLNPRYVFDTFIVGPSNRLAHAAGLAVADNPGGEYNPLFIYGGVGLGKTHLMHAIGHRAKEHFGANLRVLYLTSEQFTNDVVASIRSGTMEDFRDRYRTNDILMIDDIQFIGGKEQTEQEFFHTFNHLYQSGKHIILTSDRLPKAIPTLSDRLRTRFEMGLTVDVQPPDLETRIAILQQKGEASGMYVPRDVLDYVAQKVQSNIRELEGTLTRIIAHARLEGVPITLPLATAAMNDPQMNTRRKLITLPRIIETVARFYQVPEKDLIGKRRTKDIVIPRQVAMYIMREETDRSLVDIGEALGGKDHSTVMHGIDKTSGEIERNADRRQEVLAIREMLYADGPS